MKTVSCWRFATGHASGKRFYNGTDSAVEGMLLTNGDGGVLCYHKSDRQTFADFLYRNTRFEKGSVDRQIRLPGAGERCVLL